MIPEKPGLKACVLSKSFENTISERLRQYEIALSILAEYPQGLERFKVAIKQEAEAPRSPEPTDDDNNPPKGMLSSGFGETYVKYRKET